MSAPLLCPDLGATVTLGDVPDALLDELPGLYSSLFATREWFAAFEGWSPTGVCVLEDPRHVLVFGHDGGAVTVYNKTFEIAAADAERACRAIFRALPKAHRIHLEIMFPPGELRLPKRILGWTDHMVVDLPASVEDYDASLGGSTRRNLRLYENRLLRAFPDVRTELVVPGEGGAALLELIVKWKIARFAAKGRTTYWEMRPSEYDCLVELLRHCGEAQVTTIDGRPAAIILLFWIGDGACAQEWAHDPEYESLHLGFVSLHEAIRVAISRGATSMDLLWGNAPYKARFGAKLKRATALSVFPSHPARLHSLGEAREVAMRGLKRETRRRYWQARHAAGRFVRGRASRSRGGGDRRQEGDER